jgi:hypothetical protein
MSTYQVIQDLIANDARHLEALLGSDRVDNHVAMNANKVLRVEYTVFILESNTRVSEFLKRASTVELRYTARRAQLGDAREAGRRWGVDLGVASRRGGKENLMYLASRIDNLSRIVLVLVLDHLAKSILDSRVVAVDKVPIDKLHRHTRLACRLLGQHVVCCYLHVKASLRKLHSTITYRRLCCQQWPPSSALVGVPFSCCCCCWVW